MQEKVGKCCWGEVMVLHQLKLTVIVHLYSIFMCWKQWADTGLVSEIGSKLWLISGLIYADAANIHLSLSPPSFFRLSISEYDLVTA